MAHSRPPFVILSEQDDGAVPAPAKTFILSFPEQSIIAELLPATNPEITGGNAALFATAQDMLAALKNIRDTIESCYVAGDWVPLDAEEMESIKELSGTAIARAEDWS